MNIVEHFREDLEMLCHRYDVELHHEDGQGSCYLVRAKEGAGSLEVGFYDEVREPSKPRASATFTTHPETPKALDLSNVGADGYHPPQPPFTIEDLAPDDKPVPLATWIKKMLSAGLHPPKTPEEAVTTLTAVVARLRKEAHAVRVLDAWAKKHEEATPPVPVFHRYMSPVPGRGMQGAWTIPVSIGGRMFMSSHASATAARIHAADALLKEDPSLGSEEP